MLLSRRWLQKVRAQGNYECDTYVIADEYGKYREVECYREHEINATEIPVVGRRSSQTSEETTDLEEDVIRELEISETTEDDEEDILRDVIGQATREMRKYDYSESADEADTESAGKGRGH